MAVMFASPKYAVFDNPILPTSSVGIYFDFSGTALDIDRVLFFDRHHPGAPWRTVNTNSNRVIYEDGIKSKGMISTPLSRGDIYTCIMVSKEIDIQNSFEIDGNYGNFRIFYEVTVSTIDKNIKMTDPRGGDIMRAINGATYSIFRSGFANNSNDLVDFWLSENPIDLDQSGFIDPNKIEETIGIAGHYLHSNTPENFGDYIIVNRFPGIKYYPLILFRGAQGEYFFVKDFEGMPVDGSYGSYETSVDVSIRRLKTLNDGDPNGSGTVVGYVEVSKGKDPSIIFFKWKTSENDEEIYVNDNTDIALSNGNLSKNYVFKGNIKSDPEWYIHITSMMKEIDAFYQTDEPAMIFDRNHQIGSEMNTNIGLSEGDEVLHTFTLVCDDPDEDASFELVMSLKPSYSPN